ncbi:hypothetical protein Atai01_76590 [Amycolatopsis taiwanensis]|uniref:Uncharacterized protein n=2 Tax=Amycolatopsis taiwanensis TaxID=342230 RepID=A0A9W6RA60_9PSEU|nr:hypothetical protein Atai01_76590 [Amycolatopsis taiwanensis]
MLLLVAYVEHAGQAGRMVRIKPAELVALRNISTDGVTTSARLRREGASASTIAARCRLGGPWRRLLPGIILLSQGEPTRRQQIRAAVLHTAPDSVVSGLDALRAHGLPIAHSREVRMLVPHTRRILSREFVAVERTSRVPHSVRHDGIPFAPPARAAIDAARQETDPATVGRILSLTIYHGLCTQNDLQTELEAGNQRGTAGVRKILRRLGSMSDTYLHGVARRFLEHVPLPPPTWNMTICDRHARPIGVVAAWWDEVGLGWQFGTRNNGNPAPKMNDLALTAAGVVLVRTSREQLCTNDAGIARELTSAFASAARRRRPNVLAYGAASAAGSLLPARDMSATVGSKNLTMGITVSSTSKS